MVLGSHVARILDHEKFTEINLVSTKSTTDEQEGLCEPIKRSSRLGSVTARQSNSERQPNFAALNRGRHLCSAGRPSRWALAHILVLKKLIQFDSNIATNLHHLTTYSTTC